MATGIHLDEYNVNQLSGDQPDRIYAILKRSIPELEYAFSEIYERTQNANSAVKFIEGILEAEIVDLDSYIGLYSDLAKSRLHPLVHFVKFGALEDRKLYPSINNTYFSRLDLSKHAGRNSKYILLDNIYSLQYILETFPELNNIIGYIATDRFSQLEGIPAISFDKLNNLPVKEYKFIASEKDILDTKIKLNREHNIRYQDVFTINEFLIDLLDEDLIMHRPVYLRIDACTICNLDCPACYMRLENSGTMGRGYLKAENLRYLLSNNNFIRRIELSNSGEAILNPELSQIIDIGKEYGLRFTLKNGINLNRISEGLLEHIVKSGIFTDISISIDGVSQGVYESYRRNGQIATVLNNIMIINQFKKRYHTELPRLKWQYIMFKHNGHEAEAAKAMADALGMKIQFKKSWNSDAPKSDLPAESCQSVQEKKMARAPELLNSSTCRQMLFEPQVNFDGRLLGCCFIYKSDWGKNIFKDGFLESINSRDYRNAVKMLLGKSPDPAATGTPCASCANMPLFEQGTRLYLE